MVGGRTHIKPNKFSNRVAINKCFKYIKRFKNAIDLAGGIGAVSKALLVKRFTNVDLEDINLEYLEKARIKCP